MSARALALISAACVVGVLWSLVTLLSFFVDLRETWDGVLRTDAPLLVAAVIAFPVCGAAAVITFALTLVRRRGRKVGRPVMGWLAVVCLAGFLATLSLSVYGGISWGDGFWLAEETGYGDPGPWWELPFMFAPLLGILVLAPAGLLCFVSWTRRLDGPELRD